VAADIDQLPGWGGDTHITIFREVDRRIDPRAGNGAATPFRIPSET
jgi:hypothetical protein